MTLLVTSPLNVGNQHRVLYYDIGRSASVVMLAQDGGLGLRTNGLPEALMDSPGSLQRFSGEYWLSPLAVIARPAARDMLIVGFGGGVVVEGVPPTVRNIDVIEIEPKVIEANRMTSALRKRNPLSDPRVNIILNDARGALRLTSRRYDAIVSQPSHPWTAGASHLYTREFMQLAHDHLTLGWRFRPVDERHLHGRGPDALADRDAAQRVPRSARLPSRSEHRRVPGQRPAAESRAATGARPASRCAVRPCTTRASASTTSKTWSAALVLDAEGARRLAVGAPLITDDDNRIATSSVFERRRGMTGDSSGRLVAGMDPLQRADSVAYGPLKDLVSFQYIARRISVFSALDPSLADRIARMAQILARDARGEYLRAFYYRMNRQSQRSSELLRLAIDDYPADDSLRLEFLRGVVQRTGNGQGPAGNRRGGRKT